jgi:ketosteroid isomerase-like protein
MSESNLEIVKKIYAAFQRGDIPYIIDQLDDEVEWKEAEVKEIPFSGSYHGKAGVPEFFRRINDSVEVTGFTPGTYLSDGDRVAAFGNWQGRVRTTRRTFTSDWAMHWRLREGKVIYFQGYVDTAAEAAAHRIGAMSA